MKSKTQINVVEAFKKLIVELKHHRSPEFTAFSNTCGCVNVTCDRGSEFISHEFKQLCGENNIAIDLVRLNNHLINHMGNR